MACHLAIVVGLGLTVAHHVTAWPFWAIALSAAVAGHSVGVLAFAGHEIVHGAVVRRQALRYPLEVLAWTFALFSNSTIQRKAHNQLHHVYANTPRDPDRRPTLEEVNADKLDGFLATLVFPNGRMPWIFGIFGFHLSISSYHNKLLWMSVFANGARFDLKLSNRLRLRAFLEFAWSAGCYGLLFAASGFHPLMAVYLWLMYMAATTMDGLYIATHHMLTGQRPEGESDPVQQTVSLKLPAWVDFLHLRFSHHAEHHLYATAGGKHYPAIRRALQEHYGDRYHLLMPGQALKHLFGSPIAVLDDNRLVHVDGTGAVPVTFPVQPDSLERTVPQAAHESTALST
jgi:fatty acid desaturase